MQKLLVLIYILLTGQCFSQVKPDESRSFIILEDNTVIYGNEIEFFQVTLFKSSYLLLDKVKYETSNVRFFKNNEGTFGFVSADFKVKQIVKGNVNLFESETSSYTGPTGYNKTAMLSPSILGAAKSNYYNKGYETLKVANYDNLSLDLKDNAESMKLLGEYKKNQRKQYVFLGIGIASTVTAVATFAVWSGKKDLDNPETLKVPVVSYVLVGVGFGFDIASFVIGSKKSKYLKASIESYNGF
ncbi:MAG: hypothetical protein ACK5B9_03135 [Flavobacteriia bacterium]|jgi:hypothetical protein